MKRFFSLLNVYIHPFNGLEFIWFSLVRFSFALSLFLSSSYCVSFLFLSFSRTFFTFFSQSFFALLSTVFICVYKAILT